uniref:Uncharacterized protein n=1 Tax=Corethron hystrix TaxID=216773 RepID=A0A6U5DT73_9STRA|mmetsp:Transcript_13941/g.30623  ORF Transcript_13941/g.30623 Transcript_13941/m.30623 type:complete len:283 (+) Transcript_13941:341-1189(+)|eukprot:CAMPEP_0113304934 /NCGR_PEP_ID=MMETSP0010_2-20120614/4750_1 /TAXON_ID=216773 ORGANISM="Corethron hystrix, Strain 308" /NCGR_SAMPLE_ID=MMETSP0010_2 /ASSEMBLY_ACC=CAM_ASM_000155 /LENGTH=282 /DNA_ID=CAMNT_0000159227 /DNA_START=274 /DNA_END=1122 /DNA_ORIENTATION=- /assembly_acc=CAM_ASM_000155
MEGENGDSKQSQDDDTSLAGLVVNSKEYQAVAMTVFIRNIRRHNWRAVKELIDAADRNPENPPRFIALALPFACIEAAPSVVIDDLIYLHPDSPSTPDNHGIYPLHLICRRGASLKAVQYVYEGYPDAIEKQDDFCKSTPLHAAIKQDASIDVVKFLLSKFKDGALKEDKTHWNTPLHAAISERASLLIMTLLAETVPEACVSRNADGKTPLHLAVEEKDPHEVVDLLLKIEPGAANIKDQYKRTPLQLAFDLKQSPYVLTKLSQAADMLSGENGKNGCIIS